MEEKKKDGTKAFFELKYNPFRYDVLGKLMSFEESFKMPKNLRLMPEIETMKETSW